jgi:hypothetical protein
MFEQLLDLSPGLKAFAALLFIVLTGRALNAKLRRQQGLLPLPPGPPGHWLFGNALPREKYVTLISLTAPSETNLKDEVNHSSLPHG